MRKKDRRVVLAGGRRPGVKGQKGPKGEQSIVGRKSGSSSENIDLSCGSERNLQRILKRRERRSGVRPTDAAVDING